MELRSERIVLRTISPGDQEHVFRGLSHPDVVRYYGVRFDSAAYEQYMVQPHYDSLIAKLIVHGANRDEAIARGRRALEEMVVEGIRTNTTFHQKVLAWPEFIEGRYDTRIVERIQQGAMRRGIEDTP